MKKIVVLVGKKFQLNPMISDYFLRNIGGENDIDTIYYFQEGDKELFLHLEKLLRLKAEIVIGASKNAFSVVGKLLSTLTADNQIYKEQMLIPSKTVMYDYKSYLLHHENAKINVIEVRSNKKLPEVLLQENSKTATLHIFNNDVETISLLLAPLAQTYDVQINYANLIEGWLIAQIESKKYGEITNFIQAAQSLQPKSIIAAGNIFAYLIEKLEHSKQTITFAESCTGGLLASLLTRQPGSSAIFKGSLVSYSDDIKTSWLGVESASIEENGAVSERVVSEMLEGAINVTHADYAIAISGVAGPDGGDEIKPVGTVYIGAKLHNNQKIERLKFNGDRNYIQYQSAYYAIKMLFGLNQSLFFEA